MIWVGDRNDYSSDNCLDDNEEDESLFVPVAQTPGSCLSLMNCTS